MLAGIWMGVVGQECGDPSDTVTLVTGPRSTSVAAAAAAGEVQVSQ